MFVSEDVQRGYEKSCYGKAIFLSVLSLALYVLVLIKLPSCLKLPFYPSYAAFTFVISAIGMKMMNAYLQTAGHGVSALQIIVLIQTVIACILVIYTLIRYAVFVIKK